jgi:hypothetical protein
MRYLPNQIPNHVRRLMPREERAKDHALLTSEEVQSNIDARSERELQALIENWFRIQDPPIPAFRQRMDKKSNMPIGTPDFLVCYRGVFYALEVKVGSNHPTPEQTRCLQSIEAQGGIAAVVRSLNDLHTIFRKQGLTHAETPRPDTPVA